MTTVPTPATIVVDVQNVYGTSGDALGWRYKPDPAGIVAAFDRLGFAVERIVIPIGQPDRQDAMRAVGSLVDQRAQLERRLNDLAVISRAGLPPGVAAALDTADHHLQLALGALPAVAPTGVLADLLEQSRQCANGARTYLQPALNKLRDAADQLLRGSRRLQVPGDWVGTLHSVITLSSRLETVASAIGAVGSYAYAAQANLEYGASLPDHVGSAVVDTPRGRFRADRDGSGPAEKQIDTLCALACGDAARRTASAGQPHAVILLSEDDDLTPAVREAAKVAAGTPVRMVVAGSNRIAKRWSDYPPSPERPGWIVLDTDTWALICNLDPSGAFAHRHQLAKLATGDPILATVAQGSAATRLGLRLLCDGALPDGDFAANLARLDWGPERNRPIPTAAITDRPGTPVGKVAQLRRATGALRPVEVPLQVANDEVRGVLGAPGLWMAGDEVIAVEAPDATTAGGTPVWRILGPRPGSQHRGRAPVRRFVVEGLNAPWVRLSDIGGDGSVATACYQGTNVGLSPGDEVIAWIYERSSGSGPGRKYPPRGVLLSSAL